MFSIIKGIWSVSNALASLVYKVVGAFIMFVLFLLAIFAGVYYFGVWEGQSDDQGWKKRFEKQAVEMKALQANYVTLTGTAEAEKQRANNNYASYIAADKQRVVEKSRAKRAERDGKRFISERNQARTEASAYQQLAKATKDSLTNTQAILASTEVKLTDTKLLAMHLSEENEGLTQQLFTTSQIAERVIHNEGINRQSKIFFSLSLLVLFGTIIMLWVKARQAAGLSLFPIKASR